MGGNEEKFYFLNELSLCVLCCTKKRRMRHQNETIFFYIQIKTGKMENFLAMMILVSKLIRMVSKTSNNKYYDNGI